MKRNSLSIKTLMNYCGAMVLAIGLLSTVQSCQETINEGNFAIAKNPTIAEHLSTNPEYSSIKAVFDKVRLGNKSNASVLTSVLAARGNYTIFAPTNEAVDKYLKSIGKNNVSELTYEQAQLIAYSCVIDNGAETAYTRPEFPQEGGAFAKTDLSDRSITCKFVAANVEKKEPAYYLLNEKVKVVGTQEKLSNGYLHPVETVIAPSNEGIAELIQATENMRIMGALIRETGWADKLSGLHYDQQYENEERDQIWRLHQVSPFNVAQHRYLCYTGFVETDDVFQKEWGIPAPVYDAATKQVTNFAEIKAALTAKCEAIYGTEAQGNLADEANAVNRFVAYHFLKGKMAHNQFVQHFNEWGYKYKDMKNPQQSEYSIDIWDYFVTVGSKRALMKITQDAKNRNIYINRVCTYKVKENYEQDQVLREGIQVLPANVVGDKTYDNNAKNGYFFPINKILVMDQETAKFLGNERIRFDLTTMLPELLSYGCRTDRKYTYFPKLTSPREDGTRGYFENITNESEDTRLLYLHASHYGGTGWRDYQGDEFMVAGVYDFVLKLPPVPLAGTYEIRMGITNNELRGMCQIYFGDSPTNLTPAGLPLDMRQPAVNNDNIGFKADGKDPDANNEIDKNMRNQGYMKCTQIFTQCDGKGDSSCRNLVGGNYASLRRIITTAYMEPGKTYYLRFKSALDKSDSQFFSDYFEIVPRSVYNGEEAEDLW